MQALPPPVPKYQFKKVIALRLAAARWHEIVFLPTTSQDADFLSLSLLPLCSGPHGGESGEGSKTGGGGVFFISRSRTRFSFSGNLPPKKWSRSGTCFILLNLAFLCPPSLWRGKGFARHDFLPFSPSLFSFECILHFHTFFRTISCPPWEGVGKILWMESRAQTLKKASLTCTYTLTLHLYLEGPREELFRGTVVFSGSTV